MSHYVPFTKILLSAKTKSMYLPLHPVIFVVDYRTQTGLKLTAVFLSQPFKYWDYRHKPPLPVKTYLWTHYKILVF